MTHYHESGPMDIATAKRQIEQDGFCILRNHFPAVALDACLEAFTPQLLAYEKKHRGNPNRGPFRHYITLPFEPPFYNPTFFFDSCILDILRSILGTDIRIDQYASDTPFNNSVYQDIHADLAPLFPDQPTLIVPPALLTVNFSFVDITPERGPFEVARGSHLLPKEEALAQIKAGTIPLEPLLMSKGDVLIRNPLCLHRGTPNRTVTPRPVAVISVSRFWYHREQLEAKPLSTSLWDNFTAKQQKIMQRLPHP